MNMMLPIASQPAAAIPSMHPAPVALLPQLTQTTPQAKPPQSFWQRRPKRPLTIRGVICAIAPGLIGDLTVWHDRPLFIWKGKGVQLRVRDYNQRSKILWTQPITNQEQQRYTGQDALQPGQLYQWQVSITEAALSSRAPINRSPVQENWETFRMMPADQRQEIAIALQALEQRLQQQKVSAEDVALSKAEFFVDRGLWSDALQVIYEVNNPSAQFVEQRSAYVSALCQSSTP